MPTVTINDVEYNTDDMSEAALAQVRSIKFVDAELEQLQARIAAMNTAKNAYGLALQELLSETAEGE